MTTWRHFKERLHERYPEVKKEYDRLGPRFEAISALIHARNEAAVSQSELARRMHVGQGAISRLESAQHSPRLDTLVHYAEALGYEFRLSLVPKEDRRRRSGAGPRGGKRRARTG